MAFLDYAENRDDMEPLWTGILPMTVVIQTGRTVGGPEPGCEDYLQDNGVLVDWSPFGS